MTNEELDTLNLNLSLSDLAKIPKFNKSEDT
jgi:hypothetical protein